MAGFALPGMGGGRKKLSEIMFDKYDADRSGAIDPSEFQLMCFNQGYILSQDELKFAMLELDRDGSGQIEKKEFSSWWERPERWQSLQLDESGLEIRRSAAETFSQFDSTGRGVISTADFDAFYQNLVSRNLTNKSKESCKADLDSNGDGTIQFSEYIEWLARIGSIQVRVMFN
eukprot:TRINITY_DN179_c0_g1_i2.p1 TRINITY_DN179_c0_g1~~TRINITY_DN179_c0_g1_i2.p1  ORF type:complete len:202 (-),score=85.24 TRINITY_DN179_c0_g1_i2:70-591(-)